MLPDSPNRCTPKKTKEEVTMSQNIFWSDLKYVMYCVRLFDILINSNDLSMFCLGWAGFVGERGGGREGEKGEEEE